MALPRLLLLKAVLLVYHDPGSNDEELHKVAEGLGARAARISQLEAGEVLPRPGEAVVLLMPLRGGHARSVMEVARASGARWLGTIPPEVTAEVVARALREEGCRSVRLYFWRAKRFLEEQLEDLRLISKALRTKGLEARLEGCADCFAPMALLGGRIAEEAALEASRCGARSLGPLLTIGRDILINWLASIKETS